jgi:hypothetical protein
MHSSQSSRRFNKPIFSRTVERKVGPYCLLS